MFSFSLPAFGMEIINQKPILGESKDSTSKFDSVWTIPSISSPITGYKIESRKDGSYGVVPVHREMHTFLPWKTLDDNTLHVSIIKETSLSPDQLTSIKKALVGYGTVKFDDSQTFVSWNEALQQISEYDTRISLPRNIVFDSDENEEADVFIHVSDEKNPIYSGYTANVIEHKKIVKSNIIIYDMSNLTDQQISSIIRHEFGHALGLRHSDFADDLMFGIIPVPSYVSDHNVVTLLSLYEGAIKNPLNSWGKT